MESWWPDWSQIHQKKTLGFWSPMLALFSFLYGAGVRLRLWAYELKVFKRASLPGFVVSIGNLTTGGTGKTPAVVMLAKWAVKEGYNVAVLSRGYGGDYRGEVVEVSDGNEIKCDPSKAGDEPCLLARRLQGIPVLVSRKRHAAGLYAGRKYGTDFFILDDGFQHLELKRDLDLALIDSNSPFGNYHLLPWGPVREPISQLARADALIFTRFNKQRHVEGTMDFFSERFPDTPLFRADHIPEQVVFPFLQEVHAPGFLSGKRILAFAGIAHPDLFKDTLINLGAELVYFGKARDHYAYSLDEVDNLIRLKDKLMADYILTTEKDWVRISSFAPICREMAYLSIRFVILDEQEGFFEILKKRMLLYEKTCCISG